MAARETRRRAAADKALSSSHNKQPTSEPASNRARLHSATFPLSSATTPSLFSSFIFITALLAVLQTVASDLPLQCTRPPPSPNCGGQYGGVGFYYNASSPVPCLGWPNWGCPGNQLFATVEECQETCTDVTSPTTDPPTTNPPTMSPAEICSLPVINFICPEFEVRQLWIYNPDKQLCHGLSFFENCLDVQPNMFNTLHECIEMCGPFSPHYTDPPTVPEIITSSLPSPSPSPPPPPLPPPPLPTHTQSVTSRPHLVAPTNVAVTPSKLPPTSSDQTFQPPTTADISDVTSSSSSDPTVETGETSSDSNVGNTPLTVFDMASIGVGILIVVLIVVMAILVASFVHRRRKLLKVRRHHPASNGVKSMSNPCNHQGNGSVHFVNDMTKFSYSSATSSYYV